MAERHRKIRRLALPGIPDAKLVELVARMQEDDLDVEDLTISRKSIRQAFKKIWDQIRQVESIQTSRPHRPFKWECISYPRFLKLMVQESPGVRSILRQLWMKQPCTYDAPYHLAIYADEATPGNVLRLDNKRKVLCVYIAIREVGPTYLKNEFLWVPVAALRSKVAKRIPGGLSACFAHLCRRLFIHDRVRESGVTLDLDLPQSHFATFYFSLGNIVADGDALRAVYSSKGSSGKLPCLLCNNVLNERVASPGLVHISCAEVEKFQLASDADLWRKADHLRALCGTITKTAFEHKELLYGLTYCPEGLLWDRSLRPYVQPASCTSYDSMHCLVGNGLAQNETGYLLSALKGIGVTWRQLRQYTASDWHFNVASGSSAILRANFAEAREKAWASSGVFKSTASEMLMMQPVLLHFLYTVVQPTNQLQPHLASYEALGRLLHFVRLAKDGQPVHAGLQEAAKAHSVLFARAYPGEEVKPKDHYTHHLAGQVSRDGILVDAFVGERKNGTVKRLAEGIKNTSCFEKSVLMRVAGAQIDAVSRSDFALNRLVNPKDSAELARSYGAASATISSSMFWEGMRLRKRDLIVLDGALFYVHGFMHVGADFLVVANACKMQSKVSYSTYV